MQRIFAASLCLALAAAASGKPEAPKGSPWPGGVWPKDGKEYPAGSFIWIKQADYDEGLTQAAQACAQFRAERLIAGHTSIVFAFLPAGAQASAGGCAAWEPTMGWGSCCTYEGYSTAGAAYAVGRDGKRYMHLFVR